jgi:hypothetical protein
MAKHTHTEAAQLLLDYLMNDPQQQESLRTWMEKRFKQLKHNIADAYKEENEDTPIYDLYYSLTCEYHSRVLAEAILSLRSE